MNTAKNFNTNGSESCNTMSKEGKGQAAWEALSEKRKAFCSSQVEMTFEDQASGVMLFTGGYEMNDSGGTRFVAVGFAGKRAKPDFNYIFKTEEGMQKYLTEWLAKIQASVQRKAQERAKAAAMRATGHQLAVGDVLATCWGYEQTNVEYYQVTKLIGKCMVEICEIARMHEETGYLQGKCAPVKGQFKGEPLRRRVCDDGRSVKIESWGIWANKLESQKVAGVDVFPVSRYSAYA